ncbi:hypothetical protein KIP88_02910 [Bradyrhizobium sp. SRL28]|uniref:hypothetical protein n=1 Tax=Bradyrhizobium sp. SRL28 TaxID=2836178 RepID=UPI001BDE04DD|nr:hypothetical protein [Bradyrhizobium sp. SRL28]MBT1509442.1 hypothetical protein [Bradyrhizobium sp. SRL28]
MAEANEFFYLDKDGNKQDADLHGPILRAVDYPIDEKIMGPIRARHRAAYVEPQQAKLRAARWIKVKARADALVARGQNDLYRGWNETEHPRHPAGSPEGGQFVGDGGGSEGAGKPVPGGPGAGAGSDGQPSGAFSRESPSDAERSRNVVAIWRSKSATFYEHGGTEGAKTFHSAITRAKTGEFGASVHVYEPDEYKGMRLFMSPDGKSGFALKGDDIVSLFKYPGNMTKGVAANSLKLAVEQGGRRLDAFDTALPSLYARSGFKAVARLAWNETYKPDGWDKQTYKEFNGGEPDVVFMVHSSPERLSYTRGDGRTVSDYDEGTAEQMKTAPSIAGYRPGVRGRGDVEVKARRADWVAGSSVKTIDDVIRAAPIAQKSFAEAGRKIAADMGIKFKDPGPKTSSAKGIDRTLQKIAERAPDPAARVTDTARGAFILTHPDQADEVIRRLGRTHEVLAEPWRTIPGSNYTDRALLFRDRQTGLIGEVQITETKMLDAKTNRGGHEMYEKARVMPKGPEKDALDAKMQALYGGVLDSYKGTDWEIVDGRSRFTNP